MKLDQEEQRLVPKDSATVSSSSRRSFLRKSSVAALVTTMAAQPVWGQCTVSGAMSGGSVTQDNREENCVVPTVQGPSPQFWVQTAFSDEPNLSSWASSSSDSPPGQSEFGQGNGNAPGHSGGPGNGAGKGKPPAHSAASGESIEDVELLMAFPVAAKQNPDALRRVIREVVARGSFELPAGENESGGIYDIASELSAPGTVTHYLAAIWLNAYFGFFAGHPLPGRNAESPQQWVEHYYALSFRAGDMGEAVMMSAFDFNNIATTDWNQLADTSS